MVMVEQAGGLLSRVEVRKDATLDNSFGKCDTIRVLSKEYYTHFVQLWCSMRNYLLFQLDILVSTVVSVTLSVVCTIRNGG